MLIIGDVYQFIVYFLIPYKVMIPDRESHLSVRTTLTSCRNL